jgi:uncharacterized metal-binding protein YceD (DUF177 family)
MTQNTPPIAATALPSVTYSAATIAGKKPLYFTYAPEAEARAQIAAHLGLINLPKLVLKGSFAPQGRGDVVLRAQLSAQVVQPCTISLEPVTSRLHSEVGRDYLRDFAHPDAVEAEIGPEDQEPLPESFDIAAIAIEELTLALPLYPRAKGAELQGVIATPKGAAPLTDAALRPFAGLADLAAAMKAKSEGQD